MIKQIKNIAILAASSLLLSASFATNAGMLKLDGTVLPTIAAGNENDDSGAPLVPAGSFTGVVSIQIETDEGFFICTGSAISKRHIITAAHCVEDSTTTGTVIDITSPGFSVTTIFTDGGVLNTFIGSESVDIHPDYKGFAVCGAGDVSGFFGQCLNDDIAVITLSEDIPDGIEIYDFARDTVIDSGTLFTMVGHGTTGNGYDGFTANSADYFNKRFGFNIVEFFDCDDATTDDISSGGFSSSQACGAFYGNQAEVWFADFDGYDSFLDLFDGTGDGFIDSFCQFFGVGCGTGLGDDLTAALFEGAIGGGDSGGPSFIYDALNDKFLLAANNTFGTQGQGPFGIPGAFGEIFGGNLYAPYLDWIDTNFLLPLAARDVPAPAALGLLTVALSLMALRRRKLPV